MSKGGQGDNSYLKKKERVFYYFVLIPPLLLSAGHPLAQGGFGFFGLMRAAAQMLCVIGRLQESKEDTYLLCKTYSTTILTHIH